MILFPRAGCEFSHKNSAALPGKERRFYYFEVDMKKENIPIASERRMFSPMVFREVFSNSSRS